MLRSSSEGASDGISINDTDDKPYQSVVDSSTPPYEADPQLVAERLAEDGLYQRLDDD